MSTEDGHTVALGPQLTCQICTKPLAPSQVDDHARSHGFTLHMGGCSTETDYPCDCGAGTSVRMCPTRTPEPHGLGDFPMTCWSCHMEADS